REQVGALGHDRIPEGDWLRVGCLLAWLLGRRAFLDANQGLAIRAVEDVHPPCVAGFGNALTRLAIDHRVEEDHRARGIIVPDVVVHLLEVPDGFDGLCAYGPTRGRGHDGSLAYRDVPARTT